jgi:hypothetical protein
MKPVKTGLKRVGEGWEKAIGGVNSIKYMNVGKEISQWNPFVQYTLIKNQSSLVMS